jgi:integrase
LDEAQLYVSWQLQRVGGRLIRRETKTEASDAGLPLPAICVAALKLRREAQDGKRQDAGDAWQRAEAPLVFTGIYGTPVEPRTFNRAFTARCAKAGIRQITVHDARRTYATLLVDLEVHPPSSCRSFATPSSPSRWRSTRARPLRPPRLP